MQIFYEMNPWILNLENYEQQFICNQLQEINNLNINKNNENRDINLYIIISHIFYIVG